MTGGPGFARLDPPEQVVATLVAADGGRLTARRLLAPDAAPLAVTDSSAAAVGDVVIVERGPDGRWQLAGRPLARAGSVAAELHRLAARRGLSAVFPAAVRAEAAAWARDPGIADPALVDLTGVPFVTIDNRDSRDLDQALHLARRGDGYLLRYALADASHFVRPGSALLAEALERGASFYLPGLTLPMLPRVLSEKLISLNPRVDRRALVVEVDLAGDGRARATRLVRARIHSVRQLTYRQVQRLYDDPGGSSLAGQSFTPSLELLAEVGRLRLADARRRNVVRFERQEVVLRLHEAAAGLAATPRPRREVEDFNEQISLLCNVEGARLLAAGRGADYVQPIFRRHPAPAPERLDRFAAQLEAVIHHRGLDPEMWHWRRAAGETLAAYLERLPRGRSSLRRKAAVARQALLSNERSLFGPEPGQHWGVGAEVYARFTAPMREVVGIVTHKEALEGLAGPEGAPPASADRELRDRAVVAGNRAKELQKQLDQDLLALALARLLAAELATGEADRKWRRGTVIGFKPQLAYVLLDEPPLEVKLYLEEGGLPGDVPYRVDATASAAAPLDRPGDEALVLGDEVELRLRCQRRERWLFTTRRVGG